ncbi:MAG: hypothetical protein ABSE68_03310 [Minisyncoccia bacterium]
MKFPCITVGCAIASREVIVNSAHSATIKYTYLETGGGNERQVVTELASKLISKRNTSELFMARKVVSVTKGQKKEIVTNEDHEKLIKYL